MVQLPTVAQVEVDYSTQIPFSQTYIVSSDFYYDLATRASCNTCWRAVFLPPFKPYGSPI